MPCPHGINGHPKTCSLCLGIPARRVTIVDGKMVVDGEITAEMRAHTVHASDVMTTKPLHRRGRFALRHCSKCGLPGHNAKTCGRG